MRQDGVKDGNKRLEEAQRVRRKKKENAAILDREALQGGFGDPVEQRSHAVCILAFKESRWR
jgi:hypothetical protein